MSWVEVVDGDLPYSLRGYFCGEQNKKIITEEEFNTVKQQVLNKL